MRYSSQHNKTGTNYHKKSEYTKNVISPTTRSYLICAGASSDFGKCLPEITGKNCCHSTMAFPFCQISRRIRSRASNSCLWGNVHSSHTIKLQRLRRIFSAELLFTSRVTSSIAARLRGNLNMECAVPPPLSNVAAIHVDATASVILPSLQIFGRTRFIKCVLPVSPGIEKYLTAFVPVS